MLDFLLVIPTLNEDRYVAEILKPLRSILKKKFKRYKIVIADNGSRESVKRFLKKMVKGSGDVDLMLDLEPNSKGAAIMSAFSRYDSRWYCFIDADMKSCLKYFEKMLGNDYRKYDLIMGSRYAGMKPVHKSRMRLFASLSYNRLMNLIFDEQVKDHQFGLKIFSRQAIGLVKKFSKEKRFAWDSEAIIICTYKKLRLCEVPLYWAEERSANSDIKKLIRYTSGMAPAVLRMFYRYRIAGIVAKD